MIAIRHSTQKINPVTCNGYFSNENSHNLTCQPIFGDFQLIGDSILVRFTNQIVYNHHKFPFGPRRINYCINGQRIDQLRRRIKLKLFPLSSKVMVLIGTNDVLCGGNIHTMTKHFNSLLTLLKKSVDKILILTLPPIPKLCVTFYHWTLIRQYNTYLKSLDDGENIVVADICPLFTKFTSALEYEISVVRDPQIESRHYGKSRNSWPNHRRTKYETRKSFSNATKTDESDYRNSTDTNSFVESDIPSSEDRENVHSTEGQAEIAVQKRSSESFQNQARFVVKTLESVFGKEVLGRKKTDQEPDFAMVKQPEKKMKKIPMDLNDNICSTDTWFVESEEDSMSEHVYKSQEETDGDILDVSSNRGSEHNGEFSKFVELLNESYESPKKSFWCRRSRRGSTRNEKLEDAESSSSSGVESPKRQIYPFIDPTFRYFFEKSTSAADGSFSSNSSMNMSFSSSPPVSSSGSESYKSTNYWKRFHDSRSFKRMEGVSGRNKLLLQLSSKICHLEFYELFYSSRNRIDMIHLNYEGLTEVKNFLIVNNYVTK